ncbi:ISXO2-like transposase domain-containing protein [Aquimonas voraii]|uniref:ISXO2-like transposase domain-containing protein n=1 Tax=Aquimonas voraii TaxID=265719 RepID=A0A1G6Z3D3_9GAMM|nr:ISXO2-like transposase domain-containing protein [Aquimonas voraii]
MSGTLLASTKLPLTAWLLIRLLTITKTKLAALEFKRHLGVCYRTAWRLKHKIMQAMNEQGKTRRLSGFLKSNDAYHSDERNGGRPGRGSENKQPLMITVSIDAAHQQPTFADIEPVRASDNASLADSTQRRLAPEAEAFTDGLGCCRRIEVAGDAPTVLQTGGVAATEVDGARRTNMLRSNLQRALEGVNHAIRQSKYAGRYLAEAAYPFNRRFKLRRMANQHGAALTRCEPCPVRLFAWGEQLRSLRFGADQLHGWVLIG